MLEIFQKLVCKLGFHTWAVTDIRRINGKTMHVVVCFYCKKRRV